MRIISLLLLFILFFFKSLFAETGINELEQLSKTHRDYRIFYNLGILYAQNGEMRKTALNLKRSVLLQPFDAGTRNALSSVKKNLSLPDYLFDPTPIEKALLVPFTFLDMNASFLLGWFCFCMGSIGLSMFLSGLSKNLPFRIKLNWFRTGSFLLLSIGLIYIISSWIRYSVTFQKDAAMITTAVPLTETPVEGSMKTVDAPVGMECKIKKTKGGYVLVTLAEGHEGWSPLTSITRIWEGRL
jgi:hypothetical protein